MAYGKRATWDTIRELTAAEVKATYAESPIGSATTKAVRAVKITNNTDVTLYISDDSANNKLKLPPNSFELWDVTTNKALGDKPQFFDIGTIFSTKYTGQDAPTTGWISVECLIVESGS